MRNVIFAINITLDGCCDHTKQIADEETHEYFTHLMRDVDLLVFGRKTYQLMVPFWPDGKNANATQWEILRRIGQYVRRWKRWVLSGVRDVTVSDAFSWSVLGPRRNVSALPAGTRFRRA